MNQTPTSVNRYYNTIGSPKWFSSVGTSGRAALMNVGGSTPYLDYSDGLAHNQPTIFFYVLQCTNTTGTQALMGTGYGGTQHTPTVVVSDGASMQVNAGSTANFPFPYTITNTTVMTVCFNGANSWVRTNGVLAGNISGSVGTNPFYFSVNLGNNVAGTAPIKGYMYELLGYELLSMTTNQIQAIENALKAKYYVP